MATEIGKGSIPVGFDKGKIEQDARAAILPGLQRIAGDAALLFAGKKLIDFGKAGLDELNQSIRVTAQTSAQLRITGEAAGVTAKDIDQLGQSMLDLAGFDDEAARSAANVFLRFDKIVGEGTFKRAEADAADLAITMGTDLPQAAELLGKALQDPDKAVRLLRPAIGQLSAEQQTAITNFLALGNVAGAQGVIFDALEHKIGGTAKEFGDTLPGSLAKSQQELANARASLVEGFAPAMQIGADLTKQFAHDVEGLPGPLKAFAGGLVFIGGGAITLIRPLSDLLQLTTSLRTARTTAAAVTALEAAAAAADAEAQTADATATEANALAHTTAIPKAGGFASALGKAGVAAAAVLAIGALYEYGRSLDKTTLDQEELAKATKLNSDQQVEFFKQIAANSVGPFAGMLDDAIAKLKEMGPAGVGTLQQVSDGFKAAGLDSSKFDTAIAEVQRDQANLNSTMGVGNSLLDQNSGASFAATGAALGLAGALRQIDTTADKAARTQLDNARSVFDAEQQLASAHRNVESASRAVEDAQRGVSNAFRAVEDAARSVTDAEDRLADAEERLRKAQTPADAETLGKAQLDLADAHLRVGDAQSAVTAAEKEAAKARKDGKHDARDVADLDRKVEEAKNSLQRAIFAETDAEKALQDVQAKGTDQDQAVIDAHKQVEDATRNVEDATRNLADAQGGVNDARQRVIDATDSVNSAYLTEAQNASDLADAQDRLRTGTDNVNTSIANQIVAFQHVDDLLAPGSEARKNLDEYIAHLFVLAGIFDPALSGAAVGGLVGIPTRDSGGPLAPNQLFQKKRGGPELLIPDGMYRAPDVSSLVLDDHQTESVFAGLGAGRAKGGKTVNWYGDVINPVPEPASSSVAYQLQILADRMAVSG